MCIRSAPDSNNDNSDDAGHGGPLLHLQSRKDAMKRVNVQIPDEAHTRAKIIAVLKGITLNEYLEKAIQDAVRSDQHILDKMRGK